MSCHCSAGVEPIVSMFSARFVTPATNLAGSIAGNAVGENVNGEPFSAATFSGGFSCHVQLCALSSLT